VAWILTLNAVKDRGAKHPVWKAQLRFQFLGLSAMKNGKWEIEI
jgi:hypothetical protein